MASKTINNTRLGIFVSAGLLILVVSLYTVGKNHSMFGKSFQLRAQFRNINGLMAGNNVRYSGIQAGTVSAIEMIDDTTIEVTMLIDKKMKSFIRTSAWASVGSEGLMGNKVINISPGRLRSPEIADGALLNTKKTGDTDDMLEKLSASNDNLVVISENLKTALIKLNNSDALWTILDDTGLAHNIKESLANVRVASTRISEFSAAINSMAKDIEQGKGVAGVLLQDQKAATDMQNTITHISEITAEAGKLVSNTDSMVRQIRHNINDDQGVAHTILNDTSATRKLHVSLSNIQNGTAAFNENMEALKHNFLTKGYFRKKAKKDKRTGKK